MYLIIHNQSDCDNKTKENQKSYRTIRTHNSSFPERIMKLGTDDHYYMEIQKIGRDNFDFTRGSHDRQIHNGGWPKIQSEACDTCLDWKCYVDHYL